MNKALLDTDTLSEVNKARNRALLDKVSQYLAVFPRLTMSSVTVMEVVRGYCLADRLDKLAHFLAGIATQEVLSFDGTIGQLAGRIDADLQRSGQPIGRADPMIAATAIEHSLVLVTGNTEHFARIQALGYPLLVENWRDPVARDT